MDKPEVNQPSPAVSAMAEAWAMIDALVGGTYGMRAAGKKFLPKFPAESDASYDDRLAAATLFPAFYRTATVLAAKPFARPIDVGGAVPDEVKKLFTDVDLEGTDLQPFCATLMLAAMQYGVVGALVDVPRVDGVMTVADEKAAGVRPYVTIYPAASILGWRTTKTGGGAAKGDETLTQLRLQEVVEEPDGPWFTNQVQQIRVLTPGAWEIWRETTINGQKIWALHDSGKTSIKRISFVFFYGVRVGFGLGKSPLLELAHLNIEHYQSSSDQRTILHVARVPILFAKGFGDDEALTVGAAAACKTSNTDADLSYVEHTGAAIEAGRQSITDLEDKMRQVGAELLIQQPAVKTATATSAESEANRSTMQQIAESFDRSLESVIRFMGEWLGLTAEPEVKVFKDFGAANLSEKGGDLLLRAASADHVSSETVFDALKRSDVIPPNLKWEDEKLRIAAQPRGAPPPREIASSDNSPQNPNYDP